MTSVDRILDFWFAPGMEHRWFRKDRSFDAEVRRNLEHHYRQAAHGAYDHWAKSGQGAVALCILLDQVPRNLFRDDARAFATDDRALSVARAAIAQGLDRDLPQAERLFLYLPLEHSENLLDQERCCRLIEALDANPDWYRYALLHREIIARFGRFPHRNAALGRESSSEEAEFLRQPGSSF